MKTVETHDQIEPIDAQIVLNELNGAVATVPEINTADSDESPRRRTRLNTAVKGFMALSLLAGACTTDSDKTAPIEDGYGYDIGDAYAGDFEVEPIPTISDLIIGDGEWNPSKLLQLSSDASFFGMQDYEIEFDPMQDAERIIMSAYFTDNADGEPELTVSDYSLLGVDPQLASMFAEVLRDNQEPIETLLRDYRLNAVNLAVDTNDYFGDEHMVGGYFTKQDEYSGSLTLTLPPADISVTAQELSSITTHELGHAFFTNLAASDSTIERDIQLESTIEASCLVLQDVAAEQMTVHTEASIEAINQMVNIGVDAEVSKRVSDALADGSYDDLNLEVTDAIRQSIIDANGFSDDEFVLSETDECFLMPPDQMVVEMMLLRDPNFMNTLRLDQQSFDTFNQLATTALIEHNTAMRYETIFRVLSDSSYNEYDGGHPQDNFDEAAASVYFILREHPDELVEMIDSVPDTDNREAVVKMIDIIIEAYGDTTLEDPEFGAGVQLYQQR